jgi:hypothetical protein
LSTDKFIIRCEFDGAVKEADWRKRRITLGKASLSRFEVTTTKYEAGLNERLIYIRDLVQGTMITWLQVFRPIF